MAINTVKKFNWIKRLIRIAFFTFILFMVISHYLEEQGVELPWSIPNFHSTCPFGGIETLGRLVTEDRYIQKTHESNLWVLLASLLGTAVIGAAFCGWICPLGTVQDWIAKLGKKIFKKKFNNFVPKKLDHILGYLRYVFLGLVVLKTTQMLTLVFMNVDPYYALYHFWTGEVVPSALIVLGIILAGSFFVERPWCRWLCPFGAVQGIVQLISPWKIRRDKDLCIDCKKCTKACPMRIDVAEKNSILDTRCNKCGECLSVCPEKGALTHSIGKKVSINNRFVTVAIVLVLFFSPIVYAQITGSFTTSNKVAIVRGTLAADDIKGSMTFGDLAIGFNMEYEELKTYLGLPDAASESMKIKDIEDIDDNHSPHTIREKMSALQNY